MSTPVLLLARALDSGGSERQLTEIARALNGRGWQVHVGCFHDSGIRADELRSSSIPVIRFPILSFRSAATWSEVAHFRRYVREHGIALTHSFDAPLNLFSVAAGAFGRHVIVTSQRSHRKLRTPAEQRLLRLTDRFTDAVVVNCEAVRQHLVHDERTPARKVHVCRNGIDTDKFRPLPAPRPEPLAGARWVIGTVCVLRPEKGLPVLLEAFSRVQRQHSGVKLLIVGSGPMRQSLEDTARHLGIFADTHFEPATADVMRWMNTMDIFVLPSLSEALSNSLMEAMACGVAPVASNVGGNPELVSDGETGLLFRPGNADDLAAALNRLVTSETFHHDLAARALAFIRSNLTICRAAERMSEVYRELLPRAR